MKKIELKDFLTYRFLSGVEFAPGGECAAFVVHGCDEEKNLYNSYIHLYDFRAEKELRLTGLGKERSFLWLCENRLIFPSDRAEAVKGKQEEGEKWTVYNEIRIDGGEATEYMRIPLQVSDIKILDLEDETFLVSGQYDMSADDINALSGEEREKAVAKLREDKDYEVLEEIPFWGNGEGFTNKRRNRLYMYSRKTNELKPISDADANVFSYEYKDGCVLYTANAFDGRLELTDEIKLYHVASQKTYTLLEKGKLAIQFCSFTDDGRHVLLQGTDMGKHGLVQDGSFYIMDLSADKRVAEALRPITVPISVDSSVGSDCRMGGGKSVKIYRNTVYFTSTIWRSSRIYALDLEKFLETGAVSSESAGSGNSVGHDESDAYGGGAYRFVQLTADDGSVDSFDICNGKAVYVAMRGQALQELYATDISHFADDNQGDTAYLQQSFPNERAASLDSAVFTEKQLTHFNEEVLQDKYVAVPELITFENDGTALEGWVLRPYGYDETGRTSYPAILDIHGGPKTVYGTVYYHEMQLWASMGYFVFYCNPRGGDGRGDEFSDIRAKYGSIDYDDLMRFTDFVLKKYPLIDKTKLGVTGGSYGGFMTNWIIGHTDRFACAASQRSISNWISMFATTDIGFYFADDQTGATPWSNYEKMWAQSPLKYADRCKTPTLFIHSEQDYRCWLPEGIQMFTALKYHGVDARLCMFRGENHELSRSGKPKHRVRRLTEISDWFEKYLK